MKEKTILIPEQAYLNLLLNEIKEDRFLSATDQGEEFRRGAIFGLTWAGILTSQVDKYIIEGNKADGAV